MKAKQKGVQGRLLQINDKALFVPCAAHSLNLMVADAAKSSVKSISFFGILSRLYCIFSCSSTRWKILTDNLEKFSVKSMSTTRWESRIECIKPIRYDIVHLCDCLIMLKEHVKLKNDSVTTSEVDR